MAYFDVIEASTTLLQLVYTSFYTSINNFQMKLTKIYRCIVFFSKWRNLKWQN